MPILASLICGFVFGCGLVVSGMIQPGKVLGFLDLFGIPSDAWDPSLAVVMAAALAGGCHLVTAIRLAGAALYDPACRATARERAMEVRIVLPVRVPVGTSPISMPVAMMVVVMLLSESRTATRY